MRPLPMEMLTPELLDDLSSQQMVTLKYTVRCNSDSAAGMLFHSSCDHAHVGSLAQKQDPRSLQLCEETSGYLVGQSLLYLQLPTVHPGY